MKTLKSISALLSAATVLLCLAGGCGNNSGKDNSMADDTTGYGLQEEVAEPIDTNMPDDLRKTPEDSLTTSPPVP